MSNRPQRLLAKYELLLEHLDFEYLRQCTDGREVEKILLVLRSGEEGHFPQLTAFAEERLRQIRPESKLLRREQPLLRQGSMAPGQWNEVCDQMLQWEDQMRSLSDQIGRIEDVAAPGTMPPVRNATIVATGRSDASDGKQERIHSCDYEKWDRYDPEAEILKMDFAEERHQELVRIKNKKNAEQAKIIELPADLGELEKLSEPERTILAGKFREKGNDYYRAKEYPEALGEYEKSLQACPTAACYNNRAMVYIKLSRFKEAIADCDQCLTREPENVKAILRKAQALQSDDNAKEAYRQYCDVQRLEPNNSLARSSIATLRKQFPELPPPNAFRLAIEEVRNDDPPVEDVDFSTLIKPKKIIRDNLPEAMKQLQRDTKKIVQDARDRQTAEPRVHLQPPVLNRPLIEEL